MEDRVGHDNPTSKDVQKLIEEVRAVRQHVEKYTVTLTAEERRAMGRLRPGAENIVTIVGSLAAKQELKLPKINVQGMKADLDLQAVLAPLLSELQSLTQRVEDTITEAQAECWWATTAYYTALLRMSAADPEIGEALKPATEFFATGKRRGAPLPPKAP